MNAPPKTIRCSRLPLAIACPASLAETAYQLDGETDAADLGTAAHAWLAARISGIDASVDDVALDRGVPVADLAPLCWWGWQTWEQLLEWFPGAMTEVPMKAGILTGTADVLSLGDGRRLSVADFKSGRLDTDASEQIKGYAWLALQTYPEAESVYCAVIRIRDRVADAETYSRAQLDAWYARTVERLSRADLYNPGPQQCRVCPRGHTCPAKTALVRQSIAEVLDVNDWEPIRAEANGQLYAELLDKIKLVEKACESGRGMIKAQVGLAGGRLETEDGRELVLSVSHRSKIVPAAAWPILTEALGADLLACVDVGKTKVEEKVKAKAGRGQKGAAVKDLMSRLEVAGALSKTTVETLEVKRNGSANITANPSGVEAISV